MSQARQATDATAFRAALGGIPLFHGLGEDDLDALTASVRTRRYRRGEVIFHQGDPGDALHIVLSGRIKISSPSETGVEAILATLRPSEFFGALALLDGAPRSATATAVSATETLVLPREQFRQLRRRRAVDPRPRARRAGRRDPAPHEPRRGAALPRHRRAPGRSAGAAGRRAGKANDGEIRLDGPITQGELAAMVGSTRQSVNKLLGWFVDDGLIRIDKDTIVIVDLAGLRRAARR